MKNYYLLCHDKVKQGQEGVSFYYSDVKHKLYLRYARFQKGDVSVLVSSKHSKEKLNISSSVDKNLHDAFCNHILCNDAFCK